MKPNESKKAKAIIWGLTGGIASGKSTAAQLFAEAGLLVIDADQIARELRAPQGAAYEPIQKRFGTVDPSRLRELIFSDPQARRDLEAILHPLICEESERQIARALSQHSGQLTVIYEAALLVETHRYLDFRGLIVVSADEAVRLKRLMDRDHCSEEMARKILSTQIDDQRRRACATQIIENNGTQEELRVRVKELISHLA